MADTYAELTNPETDPTGFTTDKFQFVIATEWWSVSN